ncbi:hypothetical protein L226DRAFT_535915 [Lentinus tigrinus ALCF2SS1-7]|nr:hypothetical protein L226DRAFT_535915 [Lentinus tigrinus ALCF2SS1-7]
MTCVAPQPQRPVSLTDTKDFPALALSPPELQSALDSESSNGATTLSSEASILSVSPDAQQPICPQRGAWTPEEEAMLSAHGLACLDLLDDRVWETAAFDLWLERRVPRLSNAMNVHANKLAPLAVRALKPVAQQGMPWQFKWTSLFRAYTIITDRAVQLSTLETIVDDEVDWMRDEGLALLGLAWMCVERVVEGDKVVRESVARLATNLYKIFALRRVLHANVFRELLKRCIWEEFEAWWGQMLGLSSVIYRENFSALSAAYGIVQFIGDLYQRYMLSPSFVQRVLKTLVGVGVCPMVAIEQLRAVRLLLSYIRDSRLKEVDPDGMNKIMAAFFSNWARVNTSWMGEPFARNELNMHCQFVESMLAFWATLPSKPTEMLITYPSPTLPRTPLLASSPVFKPSSSYHCTRADSARLATIVGLPETVAVAA